MKKLIVLLIALTVHSCNIEKKDTKRLNVSTIKDSVQVKKEITEINKEKKTYDKIFTAKQEKSNDDFHQELSVNWISENEIEYKLIYSNQLCEGESRGKAINKNPGMDPEIGEYEGYAYPSIQYEEKKDDILVIIKIASANRDKATAGIFEGKYSSECSPYESVMLEKKN